MHNSYDFKFGDFWLSELSGLVSSPVPTETARKDITEIKIPGKDGSEIIDNGTYMNVEFSRNISTLSGFGYTAVEKMEKIIRRYASLSGYQIFEDTHHLGFYTKAVLKEMSERNNEMRTLKTLSLKFSRLPFWYLKSGLEEKLLFTGADQTKTIQNPFIYPAKPVIYVYFDASQTTGTYTFRLTTKGITTRIRQASVSYTSENHVIKIDFERQMVSLINQSGYDVKVYDVDIPKELGADESVFLSQSCTNVDRITIVPNWRSL